MFRAPMKRHRMPVVPVMPLKSTSDFLTGTGDMSASSNGALCSALDALDQLLGCMQGRCPFDSSTLSASRSLRAALAQLRRQDAVELASAVADRAKQLTAFNPPVPTPAEIEAVAPGCPPVFFQTLAGSLAAQELMGWLWECIAEDGPLGLLPSQAAFRLVSCCAVALGPGIQATAAVARFFEECGTGLPDAYSRRELASGGTDAPRAVVPAAAVHAGVAAQALALAVADRDSQLSRALCTGLCRPQRLDTFLEAVLPVLRLVEGMQGSRTRTLWSNLDRILCSVRISFWDPAQLEALVFGTGCELAMLAARAHTRLYESLPQLTKEQLREGHWVEQWRPVAGVASSLWAEGGGSHAVLRQLLPIAVAALRAVAGGRGGQAVACIAVTCLARLTSMQLAGQQALPEELVDCLEAAAVCAGSFWALLPSVPAELGAEMRAEVRTLMGAVEQDIHYQDGLRCLRAVHGAVEAAAAAGEAIARLAAAMLQQWHAADEVQLLQSAVKALEAALPVLLMYGRLQKQVTMLPALQQAASHVASSVAKLALSIAQLSAAQLEALAGATEQLFNVGVVLASSMGVVGGFPEPGVRGFGAAAGIQDSVAVEISCSGATGALWAAVGAGKALASLRLTAGAGDSAVQRAKALLQLVPWALQQQPCFVDMVRAACEMMADEANAVLELVPPNDLGVGTMVDFLAEFQHLLPEHPRVGAALVLSGYSTRLVSWVQQAACGPQEDASQEELEVLSAARSIVLFAGTSLCSWALKRWEHRGATEEWLRKMRRLRSTPKKKLRSRRIWWQSLVGEVLPQMEVWAEAAAECWRAEEAGMSPQELLPLERALAGRPCANLRCITVRGASEARLRGQRCGGCGAVRYCCRSCQEQDWPRHRHACQRLAQVGMPQ